MKDFSKLEKQLDIKFKNKKILTQAFCHRSYLNENPDCGFENNERLEFLGDAVLELVITEYLYSSYPQESEGELTNWRASLVNANMLSEMARELNFNEFILLSRGEEREIGKSRQYILANAFEAFVGALYLDRGYKICSEFIGKYLVVKLSEIIEKNLFKDAKSSFQEKSQEVVGITPNYKVIKEWGPDHARNFIVGVYLEDKLIAQGEGSSKQEAELAAAKEALEIKKWNK
ncbi:ribonuclease III [Patescibacteria group bacterium]